MEVALIDGTWLEGTASVDEGVGIILTNVHRSNKDGTVPLASRVFIPLTSILFIVKEK